MKHITSLFRRPWTWFIVMLIVDAVMMHLHRHSFVATLLSHNIPNSFYFLNNVIYTREIPQWLPNIHQGVEAGRSFISSLSLMQSVYYVFSPWVKWFNYIDLYVFSLVVDRWICVIGLWHVLRFFVKNIYFQVVIVGFIIIILFPVYKMDGFWYVFYLTPFIFFCFLSFLRNRSKKSLLLGIVLVIFQIFAMSRMDIVRGQKSEALERKQFKFHQQDFQMRNTVQLESLPLMSPIARQVWSSVTSDKVMMFSRLARCPDRDTVSFFLRHGDYRGYVPFMVDHQADIVQDCLTNLTADRRMNSAAEVFRYSANHVVLSVDNPQDGWLTFTDLWHPSWRASIDNQEVKVDQVNLMYKMIRVSRGIHVIEFVFYNRWTAFLQWSLVYMMVAIGMIMIKMTIEFLCIKYRGGDLQ